MLAAPPSFRMPCSPHTSTPWAPDWREGTRKIPPAPGGRGAQPPGGEPPWGGRGGGGRPGRTGSFLGQGVQRAGRRGENISVKPGPTVMTIGDPVTEIGVG